MKAAKNAPAKTLGVLAIANLMIVFVLTRLTANRSKAEGRRLFAGR